MYLLPFIYISFSLRAQIKRKDGNGRAKGAEGAEDGKAILTIHSFPHFAHYVTFFHPPIRFDFV